MMTNDPTDTIRSRAGPRIFLSTKRVAAFVAAGMAAAPAIAQVRPTPQPLTIGRPATSQIDTGDPQVDGQYTEDYTLQLSRGDRVRIEMDATAEGVGLLDTYLRLLSPTGTEMSYNDDRGDGTLNSRIIFEAPDAGQYIVRAQGFFSRTGAYRLSVSALPAAPPVLAIAPGQNPVVLDDTAGVGDAQGSAIRYRQFDFDGADGDRVRLRLIRESAGAPATQAAAEADLSNAVQVGLELSEGGQSVASASGTSGFDDPQLLLVLPRSGHYVLRASGPLDHPIRLVLQFDRLPGNSPAPGVRPWPRGATTVSGQLTLASEVQTTPDDPSRIVSLAETYALQVRPDEPVAVSLSSTDFDPVLDVGTPSILGFAAAATDNDGGGGFNSRVEIRPSRPGLVYLRVRSTTAAVGAFQLRVERASAPASPAPPAPPAPPAAR